MIKRCPSLRRITVTLYVVAVEIELPISTCQESIGDRLYP